MKPLTIWVAAALFLFAPSAHAQEDALQAGDREVTRSASSERPMPICDAARAARARNSPAAPGLEAKCTVESGLPPIDLSALAVKGERIAIQDPLSADLRNQELVGPARVGFDIGMAAAEGHTAPGPGKDRIRDRLSKAEQVGFAFALAFSLDRNRNADLARRGAAVAAADPVVGAARRGEPDVLHRLGFDIATGHFGERALGAHGNTSPGPGSRAIRQALSPSVQSGFDRSVAWHASQVVTETGESRARRVEKPGAGPLAPRGTHGEILSADLWKPPFIGNVQVTPGWKLIIAFASSQKTKPLVELGPVAPVRDRNGMLAFPAGSGAVSQSLSSDTGRYYAEFDVLREGFEVNRSYHYIVTVFNDDPTSLRERDQETGRLTMASAGNPSYVCVDRSGGEHILGVDGSLSNCFPYRCQAGRCGTSCSQVNDCTAPLICDGDGRCVPAPRN